ncbi:MAG: DsrE family protein [Phaeospirillum sp.]|nr:DsrE family protein [Phaeospirillum sp.]
MNILIILNDPPYGTERSYNGLRLAHSLKKNATEAGITIFLMADAVLCAKAGQKTPEGFYNIEKMVRRVVSGGGRVLLCGTCMDARGIAETELTEGAVRSTMDVLAAATLEADKVMVF